MKMPDFIGIGPAHGGTTWLHFALKLRVGLPLPQKETHFFDWHYGKGIQWYAERFSHCDPARPIGEICPYFPSRDACERIARHIPGCKIICQLRDPVDRAYSAYKFAVYNEMTVGAFEHALETIPGLVAGNLYARHLNHWYSQFGEDNVLVLLFDDLLERPQRYIDSVCRFIGVEHIDLSRTRLPKRAINSHSRKPRSPSLARKARRAINWLGDHNLDCLITMLDKIGLWKLCFEGEFSPMNTATEQRLRERYLPELEELERLIGKDLSAWKPGATHSTHR